MPSPSGEKDRDLCEQLNEIEARRDLKSNACLLYYTCASRKSFYVITGMFIGKCGCNTPPFRAIKSSVDDGGVVNSQYYKFPLEPTIPVRSAAGLVDCIA
jgi:hypothetical protein